MPVEGTPREGSFFYFEGLFRASAGRRYPPGRKLFRFRGAVNSKCRSEVPPEEEDFSVSWGSQCTSQEMCSSTDGLRREP